MHASFTDGVGRLESTLIGVHTKEPEGGAHPRVRAVEDGFQAGGGSRRAWHREEWHGDSLRAAGSHSKLLVRRLEARQGAGDKAEEEGMASNLAAQIRLTAPGTLQG